MNLLFVCAGNTCRSPLAAALVGDKVASLPSTARRLEIQVKSAGTAAEEGQPMSPAMEIILQERGIDSTHQSQRLDGQLLDWADLILTMTQAQKALLQRAKPALNGPSLGSQRAARLATLTEYSGNQARLDIDDPYGCDLDRYRHCARQIEIACDHLLSKLQTFPIAPNPSL